MNWVFNIILLIFIGYCDSLIAAPADPLTNELSRLQGVYATAITAIDMKYQTLQTNVPTQYLQGLDMLEKTYQQKGEFKSVMAVRAERDKINRELFAPGPDTETEPVDLKDLKAKVRALPSQLSDQKAKERETLTATYHTRLEALQRDLTKMGRISMAAAVQTEMDQVKEAQKAAPPIEPSSSKTTQEKPPPVDNGTMSSRAATPEIKTDLPGIQNDAKGRTVLTSPKLNDVDKGWTRLFRASGPTIWNTDLDVSENTFALSLDRAPEKTEWLRLKCVQTNRDDYVIIPMKKVFLNQVKEMGGYVWHGARTLRNGHIELGIANVAWDAPYRDENSVSIGGRNGWGWGTSPPGLTYPGAAFAWKGKKMDPFVVDIAVKTSPLTVEEKNHCLK